MIETTSYIPKATNETVSKVMRSNKGKDTKPELILRKMLRESGHPGYRLNWKKAPGRPDIAYPGKKVAIFINGCFWHRCPYCNLPLPKSNTEFWNDKFLRNIERDDKKNKELIELGWTVIVIWECELKKNPNNCMERIVPILNRFDESAKHK